MITVKTQKHFIIQKLLQLFLVKKPIVSNKAKNSEKIQRKIFQLVTVNKKYSDLYFGYFMSAISIFYVVL